MFFSRKRTVSKKKNKFVRGAVSEWVRWGGEGHSLGLVSVDVNHTSRVAYIHFFFYHYVYVYARVFCVCVCVGGWMCVFL